MHEKLHPKLNQHSSLRIAHVCAYNCVQLPHTTQHRTVMIIFSLIHLISVAQTLSTGGDGTISLSLLLLKPQVRSVTVTAGATGWQWPVTVGMVDMLCSQPASGRRTHLLSFGCLVTWPPCRVLVWVVVTAGRLLYRRLLITANILVVVNHRI